MFWLEHSSIACHSTVQVLALVDWVPLDPWDSMRALQGLQTRTHVSVSAAELPCCHACKARNTSPINVYQARLQRTVQNTISNFTGQHSVPSKCIQTV